MTVDPITQALLTGVAEGAAGAVVDATLKGIGKAYQALKNAISKKCGTDSEVVTAIQKLEQKPDSEGRKITLAEEVETANLSQDATLEALAQDRNLSQPSTCLT